MTTVSNVSSERQRRVQTTPFWHILTFTLVTCVALSLFYGPVWWLSWRYEWVVDYAAIDPNGWWQLITTLPWAMKLELSVICGVVMVLCLVPLRMCVAGWRRSRQAPAGIKDLHGSARWSTQQEIRASGLLPIRAPRLERLTRQRIEKSPHRGVVVGGWHDPVSKSTKLLKDNGKNHILAFAPTRSGKGVSLVLPTLLDGWRESALVYDPKGEAWALTSGFRKQQLGQRVYKFDPAGTGIDVAKFNPLAEIRVGTEHEVADAQNVAQIVVDPDGNGLTDHWDRTANSLLAAVILHVCLVAKKTSKHSATFGDVERWFGDPGDNMEAKLKDLKKYHHRTTSDGRKETHPMIAREAQSNLDRASKERSSVISTALSHLTLYRDPVIANNTGRSDWMIRDLIDAVDPATVYFVVRPADQERLRPLIRLILTQIVRRLTRDMEFVDGQGVASFEHRLLLLLDEFTSLKRLGILEDALPYMAGYGVKCFMICQDLQQLLAVYGREESLVGNCHLRVCFAPNRQETAEIISRWAGEQTIVAPSFSRSGKRSKVRAESVSESIKEHRRRLILPDEVMRLPGARKDFEGNIVEGGDMLIFSGGTRPIYGKQPLYFQIPELNTRSQLAAPVESDSQDLRTLEDRRPKRQEKSPFRENLPNESMVRVGGFAGSA